VTAESTAGLGSGNSKQRSIASAGRQIVSLPGSKVSNQRQKDAYMNEMVAAVRSQESAMFEQYMQQMAQTGAQMDRKYKSSK